MTRGRKPQGPKSVENLSASEKAKKRLRVILETFTGTKTVKEASEELGITETAFFKLRTQWLDEAVQILEPKARGRPARKKSAEELKIEALEQELDDLKVRLYAARVREELALTMPHVLRPQQLDALGKKTTKRQKGNQKGKKKKR